MTSFQNPVESQVLVGLNKSRRFQRFRVTVQGLPLQLTEFRQFWPLQFPQPGLLTHGIYDEIKLSIIHGHVDPCLQQLVHNANDWLHEVLLHVHKDVGSLASPGLILRNNFELLSDGAIHELA